MGIRTRLQHRHTQIHRKLGKTRRTPLPKQKTPRRQQNRTSRISNLRTRSSQTHQPLLERTRLAPHRTQQIPPHPRRRTQHRSPTTPHQRNRRRTQTPKQHTRTNTLGRQTNHARTTRSPPLRMDKTNRRMATRHTIRLRPPKHTPHTHQPTQPPNTPRSHKINRTHPPKNMAQTCPDALDEGGRRSPVLLS